MSKYSEIMGSFLRTGNYPIEADYIFSSEEELVQFYSIPQNKAILHRGLLKVVANEESQSLYWVVKQEEELKFVKLIDQLDIQNLEQQIQKLLSNTPEGIYEKILGTPVPSDKFKTLRGIEDVIVALTQLTKNRTDNLQSEIDQIQIGVGLSGDGAYNADQETYYLKNATSVMNALKTLDSLINKALTEGGQSNDYEERISNLESDVTNVKNSMLKMMFVTQSEYNSLSKKDSLTNYAILSNGKIIKMYTGSYEWDICKLFAEDSDSQPSDEQTMYYGYITDDITSFDQITLEMIQNSSTMVSTTAQTLGKTSLGIIPEGGKAVIAIPTSTNYIATNDNGFGGKVPFNTEILGCNGDIVVTLDSIEYKLYGTFMISAGELFIYVD